MLTKQDLKLAQAYRLVEMAMADSIARIKGRRIRDMADKLTKILDPDVPFTVEMVNRRMNELLDQDIDLTSADEEETDKKISELHAKKPPAPAFDLGRSIFDTDVGPAKDELTKGKAANDKLKFAMDKDSFKTAPGKTIQPRALDTFRNGRAPRGFQSFGNENGMPSFGPSLQQQAIDATSQFETPHMAGNGYDPPAIFNRNQFQSQSMPELTTNFDPNNMLGITIGRSVTPAQPRTELGRLPTPDSPHRRHTANRPPASVQASPSRREGFYSIPRSSTLSHADPRAKLEVTELVALCGERNISKTGNKAEILARLAAHDALATVEELTAFLKRKDPSQLPATNHQELQLQVKNADVMVSRWGQRQSMVTDEELSPSPRKKQQRRMNPSANEIAAMWANGKSATDAMDED